LPGQLINEQPMNKYNIYILGAIMLWGCHGSPKAAGNDNTNETVADTVKHSHADLKPLDKGVIIDTVHCIDVPTEKYAVYVPTRYTSAKKWPVIYFFDPHGVGNLPLKLYKNLAEKYGFIIAGTYGSRNGMQMDESAKAAQAFMSDVSQRLSIDNSRLNVFGFSGGARVACSLALSGGIAGVVACGGGFPQEVPQISQPFSIITFVGERDFNFVELKNLDRQLDESPLTHQLVVFHGKHQWPPVTDIEQAFQWMDLCAMRSNTMPKNDSIIKAVEQELKLEAGKKSRQGMEMHEYFTNKKALNFLRGLTNVDKYVAAVQDMEKSGKVTKYFKDEQTNEIEEAKIQKQYIDNLSTQNQAWWQEKIKEMNILVAKDSNSPVSVQTQRLLSFLSLAAYMGASHSFKSTDDAVTAHFLNLYGLIDPTNPEHSYLFAGLYARENNSEKAISSLRDAVHLGFTDVKRLEADSNFNAIRQQAGYKDIIAKISAMPAKIDVTQ
jgi:dienelactone hydrolase